MNFDLKYRKYADLVKDDLFLHPYSIHGVKHTKRVLYLACQLAKQYDLTEREWHLLAIACCFHDIGRKNDLEDVLHGYDSAKKMIDLGLHIENNITESEVDDVVSLIIYHSTDDKQFPDDKPEQIKLMFKIIKDADALDRVRIGDLDIRYLRLKKSVGLIPVALDMWRHDSNI